MVSDKLSSPSEHLQVKNFYFHTLSLIILGIFMIDCHEIWWYLESSEKQIGDRNAFMVVLYQLFQIFGLT